MTQTPEQIAAGLSEALSDLDRYLAAISGCTDGYCVVVKPKGMHTNGGCRCLNNTLRAQRFAYAHNRFVDAVRVLISKEKDNGI